LHAKDGTSRETPRDATRRPLSVRAILTSVGLVAGISALVAACGLGLSPRRKRYIVADVSAEDIRIQQLTRYRATDGTQSIHGTLLAEFEPGDRTATLHVAFCPPFERLPTVEFEAIDDSDVTVKILQLLHNGVQFEVRLPQPPDEKHALAIEMVAMDAPVVSSHPA
jgi:hypothetical protein